MQQLLKSSRFPAVLVMVLLMSCLCVGIAGLAFDVGPLGHDPRYVPDYPGAQQIRVLTGAQIPTPIPLTDPNAHYIGWTDKMVTFVTTDSPQSVMGYFSNVMSWRLHEGWQEDRAGGTANRLSMSSHSSRSFAPIYGLDVDTEQVGARTYVTVTRTTLPGL